LIYQIILQVLFIKLGMIKKKSLSYYPKLALYIIFIQKENVQTYV